MKVPLAGDGTRLNIRRSIDVPSGNPSLAEPDMTTKECSGVQQGPSALVLTGSLGYGHHAAAECVASVLASEGWRCRTLDCMSLLGNRSSRLGEATFRRLLATPSLYDGFHFSHLRTGSRLASAVTSASRSNLVPAVRSCMKGEPVELVVSVFATAVPVAAALQAEGWAAHSVVLCTDVNLHRVWVQPGIDLFTVTSRAAAASVRRFLPEAAVEVVPPPVRGEFFSAPRPSEARRSLGIAGDASCVLLMGGGWGLGPMVAAARRLAEQGVQVLAVAGDNSKVEKRLRDLGGELPVRAFGFTSRVPELMAAADLVVTTAGPTTCSEARVLRRPLVLLDVVPGHGRDNLQHELEQGGAQVSGASSDEVVASVSAALSRLDELGSGQPPAPVPWEGPFVSALRQAGVLTAAPLSAMVPRLS